MIGEKTLKNTAMIWYYDSFLAGRIYWLC